MKSKKYQSTLNIIIESHGKSIFELSRYLEINVLDLYDCATDMNIDQEAFTKDIITGFIGKYEIEFVCSLRGYFLNINIREGKLKYWDFDGYINDNFTSFNRMDEEIDYNENIFVVVSALLHRYILGE